VNTSKIGLRWFALLNAIGRDRQIRGLFEAKKYRDLVGTLGIVARVGNGRASVEFEARTKACRRTSAQTTGQGPARNKS
jgi:hypothetical protein